MYFRPYIEKASEWLKKQNIDNVKDLSRLTLACDLWGIENHYAAKLIYKKRNSSWNNSVRDTSRACSSLANIGIIFPDTEEWLLNQKTNDSWNKDVYNTAYALIALSDMDVSENIGCNWIIENYGSYWEHVGTTSLVITALVKQEKLLSSKHYQNFIQNRAEWILSQSDKDGGWSYISTSNLAIQALMFAGYINQLKPHIQWLLDNFNENGYWGYNNKKVIATAWSLMTLAMYNSYKF
ncbi:hypothetical protein [Methanohalobium sp.]|uniref:hypothetical protein n=1 Tax=Methanohalobium sp. TaxID=2837493 RepID=UPI0025E673BB|nr:hypothetical protein [Methanohalobium sp.]